MKPLWALAGIGVLGTAGIAGALVVASSGGEEEVVQQGETARATPKEPVSGTGPGPVYEEPLLLVPGQYISPAGSPAAQERGLAAAESERHLPKFEGELNGFRIYDYDPSVEDGSEVKIWCAGGDIVAFAEDKRLTFDYLPPGTHALNPQTASVCEDGSVQQVSQGFVTFNASFDVGYQAGERAFQADASAARVTTNTIAGRPAVIIRPLTEEGFGQTWIVTTTEHGFLGVHARDLPLNEVIRIAEGVKCAGC
jgi:hypothetical protein